MKWIIKEMGLDKPNGFQAYQFNKEKETYEEVKPAEETKSENKEEK